MFEEQTSKAIEKRLLANIPDTVDKREGSIAYDATAPASIELAEAYIMMDAIMQETFATTASRENLIKRASEFNITPTAATYAVVKGQFNEAVSIGTEFLSGTIPFTVTALLNDTEHTYKLTCGTAGTAGNNCVGTIKPQMTITGLSTAKITEIITPGEAEEDTETFRTRYFAAVKSQAYGGNGQDYKEKVLAINGVGGVKVYRCPNGGGTVGLTIVTSAYAAPTNEFVSELQEKIDPTSDQGKGYGIAPIGHTVTVSAAKETTINVSAKITCASNTTVDDLKDSITSAINAYFKELIKKWCQQTEKEYLVVYTSAILVELLEVSGVEDVSDIAINSETVKVTLGTSDIPVLGTLTLTAGA